MSHVTKSLPIKEKMSGASDFGALSSPIGIGFNAGVGSINTGLPIGQPEVSGSQDDSDVGVEVAKDSYRVKPLKRVLLWIRDIGIAVLVAILIMQFVRPTIVQQHSMENTLHENDYIFLNRQSYNFGEIKHGDIFVFKYVPPPESTEPKKNLIKRVVGLPGDIVEIKDGNVYVNNKVIDDSYTKDGYTGGIMSPMLIPPGYVFALGDNRQNSLDSRDPSVGLIDMREIIGKAVLRVFPFDQIGFVE
jgi:signal peptidase I